MGTMCKQYYKRLTLVEGLGTNHYHFHVRMCRDRDLLVFIVGGWHPERQPSIVDKSVGCKVKNIIEHHHEAIWLLGRYVGWFPVMVSVRVSRIGGGTTNIPCCFPCSISQGVFSGSRRPSTLNPSRTP